MAKKAKPVVVRQYDDDWFYAEAYKSLVREDHEVVAVGLAGAGTGVTVDVKDRR
jgi:hypothetical protein